MIKIKKPELLAPIQDYTSLTAAIENGADAVFFGIKGFNMRAGAKNFTVKDLSKIVKIAHKSNVKTYLAVNIIIYENEIKKVEEVLKKVKEAGIDAIICWDFSIIQIAKKLKIEIHISTQASIANSESAEFYRKIGAKRVVLARECSLEQIKEIKKHTKAEIEVFIHGAMCVSMSGRCFMSQFLYGKSANRGECLQPCRRKYLIKQIDGGQELELGEDYVLSPKDLCTIDFIEKILDLGVDCLKIEGRNRSPEYVANVTKAYRTIIDFIYSAKKHDKKFKEDLANLKVGLLEKLDNVYHRGNSSGFFLGKPINEWAGCSGSQAKQKKVYIGKVTKYYSKIKVAEILVQNTRIKIGDNLIFQGPTTGSKEQEVISLEKENKQIKKAERGERVALKIDFIVRKNDQIYVIRENDHSTDK
ncbi:MAG: U32 family peptidase [Candidatus Pacebacteria bacterium]|nr:U32 family peptidase [Candidatus Paceibacterota bacterium]